VDPNPEDFDKQHALFIQTTVKADGLRSSRISAGIGVHMEVNGNPLHRNRNAHETKIRADETQLEVNFARWVPRKRCR